MRKETWPDGELARRLAEAPPADWTHAEWASCCRALAEGASYGQAGALIGRSKNSIIGVAHRRGLPKRESWIGRGFGADEKRAAEAKARAARKEQAAAKRAARLAEIAARATEADRLRAAQEGVRQAAAIERAEARARADAARAAAAPAFTRRSADGCRYPFGDPRAEGFRYCEAPDVVVGKSYCPAHVRLCYTRTAAEVDRAAEVARQVVGTPNHRNFTQVRAA